MEDPNPAASRPASPVALPPARPKKLKNQVPQRTVDLFWSRFTTRWPGLVHSLLPDDVKAQRKSAHQAKGTVHEEGALKSYDEARAECVAAVAKIAKECKRVNMRYRDLQFDIETDLKCGRNDCLEGLTDATYGGPFAPNSVKRVPEIFEKPQFYIEGATASDVRQGNDGDCWFLSALCALGNKEGLIQKVCVARDESVGVYGFTFHRDGEWIYTIIDDKLYLNSTDYDESAVEKFSWGQVFNRDDAEEEYRRAFQTGSRALYFAQCSNENETWLPLLEKAFAKAHGDYRSIYGGFTGEAIEDLTGGVTTELFTSDILDRDRFWKEGLMKVNQEFLFGCATGCFDDWKGGGAFTDRKGVVAMHAYSIMDAREIKGERLVRLRQVFPLWHRELADLDRNPWGKVEWQGPWSDGSEQWTPEWMELLNHRFGNDGVFWIRYSDMLKKYQCFDRTRLFGSEWTSTQQWTTVDVPWSIDYNNTKFEITLSESGPIVIVLSQLDDRYWRGLQGEYDFSLHFRLEKDDEHEHDYIVRSHGNYLMNRSVSTDLELDAGTYSVLMKITAKRFPGPTPDKILKENVRYKQEKLLQIGLAYDLAHAKGNITETEQDKRAAAEAEARAKDEAKKKARDEFRARKYKEWLVAKKQHERNERRKKRKAEHDRQKELEQKRKAKQEATAAKSVPEPHTHTDEESKVNEIASRPAATAQAALPPTIQFMAPIEDQDLTTPAQLGLLDGTTKDTTTQEKIDHFNQDLESVTPHLHNHPSSLAPPPGADVESADTESIQSFASSFDSDLDLPEDTKPNVEKIETTDDEETDDEMAEFANDPWNAVCVVGLRVFSREGKVTIRVVRPKGKSTPLDPDDPSKAMSGDASDSKETPASDSKERPASASKERPNGI